MTKCLQCLTGLPPAMRRKVAAAAAVEAMPALPAVPGEWAFRVPGSPMSWNNALVRPSGRRPFLSDAAKEWKRTIALCAVQAKPAGWSPDGLFRVEVWSTFATSRSDADGPVKLALDALTGHAWHDDKQVVQVTASKAVDAALARLEVVVRRVE